jgi:DNA repair exonuclease SbcCD ATPase subunit
MSKKSLESRHNSDFFSYVSDYSIRGTRKSNSIFTNPKISSRAESGFTISQSPKLPISLITQLQDKIRVKELDSIQNIKKMKELEIQNNELVKINWDKENVIQKLSQENYDLKQKISEDEDKYTKDYLKKELMRKNEEINRLKDQIWVFETENKANIEAELKKLKVSLEEEKRLYEAKIKNMLEIEEELIKSIKKLEKENYELKQGNNKEYDIRYELKQIETLQSSLENENCSLKKQLETLRRGHNLHDLAQLSPDIHQISFQLHQLLIIFYNIKQGKDISIDSLINNYQASYVYSSKQLVQDVALLKKDISSIRQVISDYHAENIGTVACNTQ